MQDAILVHMRAFFSVVILAGDWFRATLLDEARGGVFRIYRFEE